MLKYELKPFHSLPLCIENLDNDQSILLNINYGEKTATMFESLFMQSKIIDKSESVFWVVNLMKSWVKEEHFRHKMDRCLVLDRPFLPPKGTVLQPNETIVNVYMIVKATFNLLIDLFVVYALLFIFVFGGSSLMLFNDIPLFPFKKKERAI